MKIAYIIFNQITWLDLIGIYDPISRLKSMNYLPDLSWDICGFTDTVSDSFGLEIKPDKVRNPLNDYDVIIVPGGLGTRQLQFYDEFLKWIKTAVDAPYKISICTGSLILGAAGFLENKKATTNYQEYAALKPYCREVTEDRIVDDNKTITAGAVSASIDLGLYLCNKWAGESAASSIRQRMDYRG
ncbi:DJ-1/PfpI family protein [Mucilaginibacter calamicampi]|uniref:DJ-1/PfpI family protein n=1 Tax=Mucilaginibacter calamicampi TaxID=1302352 RepID=A0ABW2YRP0_9SPHI